MGIDEKGFKLADSFSPLLYGGEYRLTFEQKLQTENINDLQVTKNFYVTANTETLSNEAIFSIHPASNQQGIFSTDLPFMVFNEPTLPWIVDLSKDAEGNLIPWLALIVISENEIHSERDVVCSLLEKQKGITTITEGNIEKKVYFSYEKSSEIQYKPDDKAHLISISKKIFEDIMPLKEDRVWLAHTKKVDLSDVEDSIAQKDGLFSVVIANRFPPSENNKFVKNTVHLVAAYHYDDDKDPKNFDCDYVELISLYHWDLYSASNGKEEKSFVSLIEGLDKKATPQKPDEENAIVVEKKLMPHFLRKTGEKTYSWYHSPIQPMNYQRARQFNGEKTFTADGRLIYDKNNGIFDISYAAAFNLGRLVTLSHNTEAQQIIRWRKNQAIGKHHKQLQENIGINHLELQNVLKKWTERK